MLMSDPIKAALFAGNKIQAIKLYREQTGLGLKEAKDAVEKLETELHLSSPSTPSSDQSHRVRDALFEGNKIQAIKHYREQTRVGLKEAKDAVEKLEGELRASSPNRFTKPQNTGCFAVIVALGLIMIWRVLT